LSKCNTSSEGIVQFLDEAGVPAAELGGTGVANGRLAALCAAFGVSCADLVEGLASTPPGAWPVPFGQGAVVADILEAGGGRVAVLRGPDGDPASALLDSWQGARPAALLDGSGRILSCGTEFAGRFEAAPGMRASTLADQASRASFSGALEECLSGRDTASFTCEMVEQGGGTTSWVMSLRRLPVPGSPVLMCLDPPSMSPAGLSRTGTGMLARIFAGIPVPAIIVSREGLIVRVNDSAAEIALAATGRNPLDSHFSDWIAESDRESVVEMHRVRSEGGFAPFSYDVHLAMAGEAPAYKATALLMPESGDTLVFISPPGGSSAPADAPGQTRAAALGNLTVLLKPGPPADLRRLVLDILRIGTGARGVSLVGGGAISTAGEVPLGDQGQDALEPLREPAGERWQKTADGLFDVSVVTRLRSGACRMTAFGVPYDSPAGVPRLVISLVPMFADYIDSVETAKRMSDGITSVMDTWDTLSAEKGGLDAFLQKSAEGIGATGIHLWGPAGSDGQLQLLSSQGEGRDIGSLNLQAETSAGWAYAHNETVYVADTLRDSRFTPLTPGSRSEVSVPLLQGTRARGVLSATNGSQGAFGSPVPGLLKLHSMILSLWLQSRTASTPRDEPAGGQDIRESPRSEVDDILLSLGHRLKAPAAAIRGFVDLLESGRIQAPDEAAMEAVRSIAGAARSLSESVERLLSLVRLMLREDRPDSSWGDPEAVVQSLAPVLGASVEEAGLHFRLETTGKGFSALFDRSRLEEILRELVDNAIRFNRPGGDVAIRMRQEGSSWTLEVEDSGRGIPSRSLPYIFDRFYRSGDDPRSLGIGLTIVRRLVERLGGMVTVFSREGRGSRFVLRFPLSG